jgi:signal transduction histidine kinase
MEENALVFVKTTSLEDFKKMIGVDKIDIKKTPVKGSLIFEVSDYGTGFVSNKIDWDSPLGVSIVNSKEKSNFLILHNHTELEVERTI